ncbi:MAG: TetR/AcrR family transcriptional regulator [Cyclobacteriaceae bacterium]|nr:TetR/AcrR family transcriptional regulator [Cyclobacteriaceae bacterium]
MSGLREKKAAILKIRIYKVLQEELKQKRFDDIKVTDICKAVDISKVTFFKYFSCKEELLRYYFRIWCFNICVDLYTEPKRGIEGIYYLFDQVIKALKQYPSFFYSLLSYQINNTRILSPYPLRKEERKLLYPQMEQVLDIEVKSVHQLLENFVLEAVFNKDIQQTDTSKVAEFLHVILMGTIIRAGVQKNLPIKPELKQNLDKFLMSVNK